MVQALSRAADLLGLVPVFPVGSVSNYTSGSGGAAGIYPPVFRDCVLVRNATVGVSATPHITTVVAMNSKLIRAE